MATFEIPDGPTSVDVPRPAPPAAGAPAGPATATVTYNVTNRSNAICDGRLAVQVLGSSKADWFGIDGERERAFSPGETQTANVRIAIPAEVAAGDYPFRLRVVAVNDPDNDHAEGPVTTAKLAGAAKPTGGGVPWWVWLLIGLVVLAALGGGLWWALSNGGDDEPEVTNNQTAPQASVVPDYTNPPRSVDELTDTQDGYRIVKQETANTGRPPRTVFAQEPAPGTELAKGQRVIVSFEPGAVVPELPAGTTFTGAPSVLRRAGLEPGDFLCDRSSGSPGAQVGAVTGFSPSSGTRVAAPSKVNIMAVQDRPCPRILVISPIILERMRDVQFHRNN